MKRLLIIVTLIFFRNLCYAQLIEDSNAKLKSARIERKNFLFFEIKKKAGDSEDPPKSVGKPTVRYTNPKQRSGRNSSPKVKSSEGIADFKAKKVSPRSSSPQGLGDGNYAVFPMYSEGIPFRGSKYDISPRFSSEIPFEGDKYAMKPRYSTGIPFRNQRFSVSPRYNGTKISFIDLMKDRKLAVASYYQATSLWAGDYKMERKLIGEQHPSSNYHSAMRFQNPEVREALRKWNIYWIRLNGNKQNPNGVKESVGKPEFDKKERVIWNN